MSTEEVADDDDTHTRGVRQRHHSCGSSLGSGL
jgi:hypothetical protein